MHISCPFLADALVEMLSVWEMSGRLNRAEVLGIYANGASHRRRECMFGWLNGQKEYAELEPLESEIVTLSICSSLESRKHYISSDLLYLL